MQIHIAQQIVHEQLVTLPRLILQMKPKSLLAPLTEGLKEEVHCSFENVPWHFHDK